MSAPALATVWRELEDSGLPAAEKLRFAERGRIGETPILVGIDGAGYRHLCIPSEHTDLRKHDVQSRGVTIEVRELLAGSVARRFVDVKCAIPALNELFSIVATDMLEQLQRDCGRPFETCHEVLERWRELLDKEHSTALGREQLAALMGELLVLERLTTRSSRAVESWVGPEKAVHDFVCGALDIEVKTSLRTTGRMVDIHGLTQLEASPGTALYLSFARLRFTPGRGRTVPEVVDSIAARCSETSLLFERLRLAGYDPVHRGTYESVSFEVIEEAWFHVTQGFPRIVMASFATGQPPSAVIKVDYLLDLDAGSGPPIVPDDVAGILDRAVEAFSR